MKVILFLTFSATASALQKTEEILSDELNDWNPTWKKGLVNCLNHCLTNSYHFKVISASMSAINDGQYSFLYAKPVVEIVLLDSAHEIKN